MTDRERVDIQMHRHRIVQAQLDQIERDLKAAPVELTIPCPTEQALVKMDQYGYHHVGEGLFRYGHVEEKPRPAEPAVQRIVKTTGWWDGFMWGVLVVVCIVAWFRGVPSK